MGLISSMISRQEALVSNKLRYFTGRPCKHGHTVERYVRSGNCIKCNCIAVSTCYAKNPKPANQRSHDWYIHNKELNYKRARSWKANNKERALELDRKSLVKRRRENPEKFRAYHKTYRANKLGADGEYTAEDIKRLKEEQHGICAAPSCSKNIIIDYHVDHMVPLSRGGPNWPTNLQILCPSCNMKKSNKLYDIWLEEEMKKVD